MRRERSRRFRGAARLPLALPAALAAVLGAAGPATADVMLSGGPAPARVAVTSYRDMPYRSVVRQHYDFSCGSAALATLLRHHYGVAVDEAQVFRAMYEAGDKAVIEKVGFSLLDMQAYLAARGVRADGYRMTLDELAAARAPAILMMDTGGYRHFVVLKGVRPGQVLIGDPALGLKVYSRDAFTAQWNGVVFMLHEPALRFDVAGDWSPRPKGPADAVLTARSLAELTRELPPLYQVTTRFSLDPWLR